MRILLFLLLLMPLAVLAQTVTVKGHIVDFNDNPVVSVRVKIGSAASAYTNEDGLFEAQLSLRSHANRRITITAEKRGYKTYEDNSLIITDSKTRVLNKIVLLKEGENPVTTTIDIVEKNNGIIEANDKMIEENQSVLNNMENLPIQYRNQVRVIQMQIDQARVIMSEVKAIIRNLEDEIGKNTDKDRFFQNLLTREQGIISQQERIVDSQEEIIKVIVTQAAKNTLKVAEAKVKYLSNNEIDITFRLQDAFAKNLTANSTQVIGVKIEQLTGQSSTKVLKFKPEGSQLERDLLEQNVALAAENTIRFTSPNAFKNSNRKKGYVATFYVGDAVIGVQGFRK